MDPTPPPVPLRRARPDEQTPRADGWVVAGTAITRALVENRADLGHRLDEALESLRDHENADAVVLFVDEGAGLAVFGTAGADDLAPGLLLGTHPPPPGSLADAEADDDLAAALLGWPVLRVRLVPVGTGTRPSAAIALGWVGTPGRAAELDRGAVRRFLVEVEAGLRLAARVEDRIRHAISLDRERMARDLHDHVIQRLFAVGLSLRASAGADRTTEAAVTSLDETITDIRGAIFTLQGRDPRPDAREDLDDLVAGFARPLGFLPVLIVRGPLGALPSSLRRETVAVTREALSNVVRHAGATRVTIDLDVGRGTGLTLTVTDDGRGITAGIMRTGLGVGNVIERARVRHGWATVDAVPTGGTRLRWFVPSPGL